MKKLLIPVIVITLALFVQAVNERYYAQSLTVPTSIGANATNTTIQTAYWLPIDETPKVMTFTIGGKGASASTAGVLTVCIETATVIHGATTVTNWQTATLSKFKPTLDALATSTNFQSDWYVSSGVRAVRVGRVENTFPVAISAITVDAEFTVQK